MSDTLDPRRKRLRFRSWHRGMKEGDLILGRFADEHIAGFTEEQLTDYEALLDQPDPLIFEWVSGRAPVPAAFNNSVTRLLMKFDTSVLHS